jgi:hypothetical protein
MNLSKPVNPIRNYAVGSVITALILLGPVVTFLMVIAAQILIDLLTVGGTSAVEGQVLGIDAFGATPGIVARVAAAPLGGRAAMIRQSSTCSEMLRASSTSIPRYRTVLSSFVCPSRS